MIFFIVGLAIVLVTLVFAIVSMGLCVKDIESEKVTHAGLLKAIGLFVLYAAIHFFVLYVFDENLSWRHYEKVHGVWTLMNRGWIAISTILDICYYAYLFAFGAFAYLNLNQ